MTGVNITFVENLSCDSMPKTLTYSHGSVQELIQSVVVNNYDGEGELTVFNNLIASLINSEDCSNAFKLIRNNILRQNIIHNNTDAVVEIFKSTIPYVNESNGNRLVKPLNTITNNIYTILRACGETNLSIKAVDFNDVIKSGNSIEEDYSKWLNQAIVIYSCIMSDTIYCTKITDDYYGIRVKK